MLHSCAPWTVPFPELGTRSPDFSVLMCVEVELGMTVTLERLITDYR